MIKNRSFTTFWLCFYLSLVFHASLAQQVYKPTIEPGKEWHFGIGTGMGNFVDVKWEVTCDTVEYNGQFYAVIEPSLSATVENCTGTLYVREDINEKKVYFLPEPYEGGQEILYLDYSLEQGEDVFVYPHWANTVVDTVRDIDFLGETVRFIDFGCNPGPCDGFIEGFGLARSGSLPGCMGWTEVLGLAYIYDCDETNDVEQPVSNEQIRIYPNPVRDRLNILFNDPSIQYPINIKILSVNGTLLWETSVNANNAELNLPGLPGGILLLTLQTGEELFLKRLVKY